LDWGYRQLTSISDSSETWIRIQFGMQKYVMKKYSIPPIQKCKYHRYESMHFVPYSRRISASGTPNKLEKIIHVLKILQCSLYL
jgi:hypothetical protein